MHLDQILLDMLTGLRAQRVGLAIATAFGLGTLAFAVPHFWNNDSEVVTVAVVPATVLIAQPKPAIPITTLDSAPQDGTPLAPVDLLSLIRSLQKALRERGCYDGPTNGIWTAKWKLAMGRFADSVNARLPVEEPDSVMLALVLSRPDASCRSDVTAEAGRVPRETVALPSPAAAPTGPQPQDNPASGAAGHAATKLAAPEFGQSDAIANPDAEPKRPAYRKPDPAETAARKPRRIAKQDQSYQSISKSLNKSFKSIQRSLASVFN